MSPDDDGLLAEIIAWIEDFCAARTVTPETRLYADLGMTGDDADQFLSAFAAKYGVDMSSLVWQRYFDDEPTSADMLTPAVALAVLVLSPTFAVRWQAAREAEREITISHLAEVARARVWRDPGEEFRRAPKAAPLILMFSTAALLAMAFFVLLGLIVIYGFVAGELGENSVLALVGVATMSLVLPPYLAFASWRQIQRKLASA